MLLVAALVVLSLSVVVAAVAAVVLVRRPLVVTGGWVRASIPRRRRATWRPLPASAPSGRATAALSS